MTEDQLAEIAEEFFHNRIESMGGDVEVIFNSHNQHGSLWLQYWMGADELQLDGNFTADQLEAIAWFMRKHRA